MKLNENGDFCLLYVEAADEKQHVFETIGEQQKPVVLMLPQAGQPRSRLFQRPEDFSDLKHIRRQSGVSIVFLTAGSELLAQMAARYGFPSYASIDDFADFLAHGRHSAREEESAPPLRRFRTGPLMPSAAVAQLAALRQAPSTRPLNAAPAQEKHVEPQKSARPLSAPLASDPWTGHQKGAVPLEYTAAFHEAQTSPIGDAVRLAWPLAGEEIESVLPMTPPTFASVRHTPIAPTRAYGYRAGVSQERGLPLAQEEDGSAPRLEALPRKNPVQGPVEAHTRHPGWPVEERMFESGHHVTSPRESLVPPPPLQVAQLSRARATRDLREHSLAPSSGPQAPVPTRGTSTGRTLAATAQARPFVAPPAPSATQAPGARVAPATMPVARTRARRASFWPLFVILSLLILSGGALGSFVAIARVMPASAPAQAVGSITFGSSEQLNENTSQGIDDQVQVNLHSLVAPASGKSYYAWLLGDTDHTEAQSILLGKLQISNGAATLFYAGDAQHTNLLQITSRFLVTEEASGAVPLLPSPDQSTWRYYGALPAQPDPKDAHHYSFLNHLRHLLADEPILDEMELPGGLNNWFSHNTEELLQLSSSARDHWQNSHNLVAVRSQGVQILSYLDGMSFVQQDLPAASADAQNALDTHQAALGLLNVQGETQNPPGYMDQIVYHLNGLVNAPGAPGSVRTVTKQVLPVLGTIETWLQKLRSDDKKLLTMDDFKLGQNAALSLLDDMVLQASNVYSGTTDPATGHLDQGVAWVRQQLQSLATLSVSTYVAGQTPVPEVAPSSQPGPAFVQPLLQLWKEVEQCI